MNLLSIFTADERVAWLLAINALKAFKVQA
jgi:hypothetical protein